MKADRLPPAPRTRAVAVVAFAIIAAILTSFGYLYYRAEKENSTQAEYQTLAAIGELKAHLIQQWRKERLAEIERASRDPLTRKAVASLLKEPGNPDLQKALRESVQEEMTLEDHAGALVFDAGAKLLAATDNESGPASDSTLQAIHAALASNKPAFSDFYRGHGGVIHIDLVAPVPDDRGQPMAVLVVPHEAASYIYPLVQSWPIPSRSAEAYLVEREGEDAVYLTGLRFQNGAALSLSKPLADTSVSAVEAALGKRGVFEGVGYRGAPVVSDLRQISGSPWFLVAEMDAEEILAHVRFQSAVIIAFTGMFILLAGLLVAFFYRQRQIGLFRNLVEADKRKAEAQEHVLRSETNFREVIQASPMAMAGLDFGLNVTFLNPEFVRLFGYSKEEIPTVSHWWPKAYPDPAYQKWVTDSWRVVLDRAKQTGLPVSPVEVVIRCKDGTDKNVIINTALLSGESGEGFVISFVDITERQRAEAARIESDARFRSYFELPLHGACITSIEKGWLGVNERLCSILGYSQKEIVGKTWSEMTHPDDLAADSAQFDRVLSGEIDQYRLEKRFIRKDGSIVWTEISVGCVRKPDGHVDYFVCVLEDITERKNLETRLIESADRAEAGSRAKSDFLAVMSHELRTPLNGVLGFAELLADTPLNNEQKSYMEMIGSSGKHLLAVVNDILDFSSIEKGSLAIHGELLGVAELVKSSEQAVQKSAADKGILFRGEIGAGVPEQVFGDPRRIRQILINLLGNAVKFTSSGSVVLRVATAVEGTRRFLEFSVEDTGIGMSPETMAMLFKPFTQADMKMSRPFEGVGIGLAISQRLAEAMGGMITVVSTVGKGSTFTFRLPLEEPAASVLDAGLPPPCSRGAQSHAKEGALPQAAEAPIGGDLVLVVEDDEINSRMAGKMLQSLGYRVEYAANGAEAVEAFEKAKYFAILMDIKMPVMSGLEAARKIRDLESGTRVPIIALTANVMRGDRERYLAGGMDDFLSKPFKKEELAAILAQFGDRKPEIPAPAAT